MPEIPSKKQTIQEFEKTAEDVRVEVLRVISERLLTANLPPAMILTSFLAGSMTGIACFALAHFEAGDEEMTEAQLTHMLKMAVDGAVAMALQMREAWEKQTPGTETVQ